MTSIKMTLEDVDFLKRDQLLKIEKFESLLNDQYYKSIDLELEKLRVNTNYTRNECKYTNTKILL